MSRHRICFEDLPIEVYRLVAALLTSDSLFPPKYVLPEMSEEDDYSALCAQQFDHYGIRTEVDEARAHGLMNWSCTNTFFRLLLAPEIFKGVTLRSKQKSIDSIQALSRTTHWQSITALTFAGTFDYIAVERPRLTSRYCSPLGLVDLQSLASVLSNLPPALKFLTLDFPSTWVEQVKHLGKHDPFESEFEFVKDDLSIPRAEAEKTWRRMVYTVLESVSQNDFSGKTSFTLNLFNIPPLSFPTFKQRRDCSPFAQMLGQATSFTMSFSHFSGGNLDWGSSFVDSVEDFCSHLSDYFLRHLCRVRNLFIRASEYWELGITEDDADRIRLALPPTCSTMPYLEELHLEEVFLCQELIDFIKAHRKNLRAVHMHNCWAYGGCDSAPEGADIHWADFFHNIVAAKPEQLQSFSVTYANSPMEQLGNDLDKCLGLFPDTISLLEEQSMQPDECKRRELYGYTQVNAKHTARVFLDEYSLLRAEGGEDHEAWLKLVEVLERNEAKHTSQGKLRGKVIDAADDGATKPLAPSKG